jgi:hypothetical protein
MTPVDRSRRSLLQKLTLGVPLIPLAAYQLHAEAAADMPLLSTGEKEAKTYKYVEDASKAQGAIPGSTCANCALYQGHSGSLTGPCQIFPNKVVKAAGWCSSWAPQM